MPGQANGAAPPEGTPRRLMSSSYGVIYLQVLEPGLPLQLFEQHCELAVQLWPAGVQPPPPPSTSVQLYRALRPAMSSLLSGLLSQ